MIGKQVEERPVWGIDAYTRRMLETVLDSAPDPLTPEARTAFIEKARAYVYIYILYYFIFNLFYYIMVFVRACVLDSLAPDPSDARGAHGIHREGTCFFYGGGLVICNIGWHVPE